MHIIITEYVPKLLYHAIKLSSLVFKYGCQIDVFVRLFADHIKEKSEQGVGALAHPLLGGGCIYAQYSGFKF